MNDSLAGVVEQRIREVVLPLEESGVVIIEPNFIANSVMQSIDPAKDSPELVAYCATMDLRLRCRKFLARRHDPIEKAKAYAAMESEDLFSGMLQDYYPARRQSLGGEFSAVYVRRDELSRSEAENIAQRMAKSGNSLISHADALLAYIMSKAA